MMNRVFFLPIFVLSDERVLTVLARLPEDFAEAVALHDIEGFKYREIAEITNVAIGTVMSRIARGRRLLAAVILEQMDAWDLEVPGPTAPGKTASGDEQ